jgi:hypothetical protein
MNQIVDKIRSSFQSNLNTYLATYRAFFKNELYTIILLRAKSRIINPEDMWPIFESELANIIFEQPLSFTTDKTLRYPFFDSVGSAYLMKSNPEIKDRLFFLDGDSWIDPLMKQTLGNGEPHLGSNLKMNVVAEWWNRGKNESGTPKYLVKDVLHALVDLYDPEKKIFTGDWKVRLTSKKEAKENNKKKYLGILENTFSARTIGVALKEIPRKFRNKEFDKTHITQPLWRTLIRSEINKFCKEKNINTSSELRLALSLKQIRGHDLEDYLSSLIQNINIKFGYFKARFKLSFSEIESSIISAAQFLPSEVDTSLPEWRGIADHCEPLQQITKLDASAKTIALYIASRGPLAIILEGRKSLVDIHSGIRRFGATEASTRKFIVRLASQKLWNTGPSAAAHDSNVLLEILFRFIDEYSRQTSGHKNIPTKIIELITSEVAGSGPREPSQAIQGMIRNLDEISVVEINKLTSLSALGRMLDIKTTRLMTETFEKLNDMDILTRDDDFSLALSMNASPRDLLEIADHSDWQTIRNPVSKLSSRKLMIELLPFNHVTGILGCLVSGVCIDFGGESHLEQRQDDCLNLIVRDNKKILLWGLVVHCEGLDFYLNNLQGGLPSRYSNLKDQLLMDIKEVLGSVGNIHTTPHYFNAMDITEGLKEYEVKLPIRDFRLDVRTTDGFIKKELFRVDYIKGLNHSF